MHKRISIISVSLWLVLSAMAGSARSETILYTERSLYRNIIVSENSGTRCIRFGRLTNVQQSCFSLKDPDAILFDCNKMLLGALYLAPNPRRVLTIGLGGSTLTSALSRMLPDAQVDVVEIDPAMVRVAREYFNFRPGPKVRITVQDGRVFVKRAIGRGEKYDLVILDAFDEVNIPTHLMTRQFLEEVKQILAADGVLAANTYYYSSRYDSESVTYDAVFGSFFNLKKFFKNERVIITKQGGPLPSRETLTRNSKLLQKRFLHSGIEASWLLPLFSTEKDWDESEPVLTDQFLPF